MTASTAAIAVASYGFGAVAYAVLAIQIGIRRGWAGRSGVLLFAALSSFLWQVSGVVVALAPSDASWLFHLLTDGLRFGAWFGFVLALLQSLQVPGLTLGLSTRRRFVLASFSRRGALVCDYRWRCRSVRERRWAHAEPRAELWRFGDRSRDRPQSV
jgi:hypothetical protein